MILSAQPRQRLSAPTGIWLVRLWAAGAALWGILFFYRMGMLAVAAYLLDSFSSRALFLPIYLALFATLALWFAWTGFRAIQRPGARSISRLVMLTAWILFVYLVSPFGRDFAIFPVAFRFPAYIFRPEFFLLGDRLLAALVAFLFCRVAHCWLRQHAPLPAAEREQIPEGISRWPLIVWSALLGPSIRLNMILLNMHFARHYSPNANSNWQDSLLAIAIATAAYYLLKSALVREKPKPRLRESANNRKAHT